MEIAPDDDDTKTTFPEDPLLDNTNTNTNKGGLWTLLFILANGALGKMATFGLMPNMILYLMKQYHMEMTTASNVLYFWSAASLSTPLIGAIIADSFLGRFHTIGIGSAICFLGMILLWLTAIIPQARPPPCDDGYNCSPPTIFQFSFLCTSLVLISIGGGGMRSCTMAFGANQLENGDFHTKSGVKESYFSGYFAVTAFSVFVGVNCIVYIQDNIGWGVGFAVPAVLLMSGALLFYLASPWYVKLEGKPSLLTGMLRVGVASYRNRDLEEPEDCRDIVYQCRSGSPVVFPSSKVRFLNKACIVRDPEKDLTPDGEASDPWRLCTVEQVEELKALLKVIPIWSTGMIMFVNICQPAFQVLQASSVDRRITSGFTIPAASFNTVSILAAMIWIAVIDRIFRKLASRITRRPVHVSCKTRQGLGIFLSLLAMLVTALVESIRRGIAIKQGFIDDSQCIVPMSAMWLVPQLCLTGFGEASNAIAQSEFYFSEFPRSMSSIASTLTDIGASTANVVASILLNTVDAISKAGGHESWISSNINKGRYDYYYLVLAGLSMANLIYFKICSGAYGPLQDETKLVEEKNEFKSFLPSM